MRHLGYVEVCAYIYNIYNYIHVTYIYNHIYIHVLYTHSLLFPQVIKRGNGQFLPRLIPGKSIRLCI